MSDLLSKALGWVRDDVKNHWEGKGRWANPLVGKRDEKILDRVIGDPKSMPLMMALGLLENFPDVGLTDAKLPGNGVLTAVRGQLPDTSP